MSLRAVHHSQYFKNGRKVLTYVVQGTQNEIEEYKIIESARQNKLPEALANVNGFPLLFIVEELEFQAGRMPQPSYDIIKNYNGTGYNRDTTKQDMAMYAKVAEKTIDSMAEIQAKRRLGIDVGDRAVRTTRPQTQQAAPIASNSAADTISELIAEGADDVVEPEVVGAGTETIAD